jgi:hypothetical protein
MMPIESDAVRYLTEPLLRFGHGQCADNPKDGLFMFGPLTDERKPAQIRAGVVGTPRGIAQFSQWVERVTGFIPPANADSPHQRAFPGFESVFNTRWPTTPVVEIPISANEVSRQIRIADRHRAIYETVSLFEDPIRRRLREDDAEVDVWFVVIPDEVWRLGRPLSKLQAAERIAVGLPMNARFARRLRREPSLFPEDMEAAKFYEFEMNFHHQLKARLIDIKAVVQVVRESSLGNVEVSELTRRLQDPATVAWNLCTTAFFKSGGRPWKLGRVRDGVCYVGLVFKKNPLDAGAGNACCGAQMFLDSGDGLVFKGAVGPWYSEETREFHLKRQDAENLIAMVVKSYVELHGSPPRELFIHARTRFNEAEWEGFRSGAPVQTEVIGIRIVRSNDLKLFRMGTTPVLRGTALKVNPRVGFVWTMGYIPTLKTYPGREVPNPLSVEICRGWADLDVVLADVMGLTKLNFNACIFADGLPVTLRFADAVGEILTAAPPVTKDSAPLPFRHYI